jgi:CheY-like chemotaxis protein
MRVLVIEDEMTIAMMIEDMLIDLGHEVVDLAMRLPQALDSAARVLVDFAILDVNLDGEKSFPVADLLTSRNIPYVFATGYGRAGVDERYHTAPILSKPFTARDLETAMRAALP